MKKNSWTKIESTITTEQLKQYVTDVFANKTAGRSRHPIGHVTGGIYHLGDGFYGGKQVWDNFTQMLKYSINDETRDRTSHTENRTEENNVKGRL